MRWCGGIKSLGNLGCQALCKDSLYAEHACRLADTYCIDVVKQEAAAQLQVIEWIALLQSVLDLQAYTGSQSVCREDSTSQCQTTKQGAFAVLDQRGVHKQRCWMFVWVHILLIQGDSARCRYQYASHPQTLERGRAATTYTGNCWAMFNRKNTCGIPYHC